MDKTLIRVIQRMDKTLIRMDKTLTGMIETLIRKPLPSGDFLVDTSLQWTLLLP